MSNKYMEESRGFITPSKLKDFINSPEQYYRLYVLEQDTSQIEDPKALEIGTMVDRYLLSPKEFDDEYALPIGPKPLKKDLIEYCQAYGIVLEGKEKVEDLERLIYGDKQVVSGAELKMLKNIKAEVMRQPLYNFKEPYEIQKELIREIEHRGKTFPLRGTVDRFRTDVLDEHAEIRDLKTSSMLWDKGGISAFQDSLQEKDPYLYKLQLSMYAWLTHMIYKIPYEHITCYIDAISTTSPWYYECIKFDTVMMKDTIANLIIPAVYELIDIEDREKYIRDCAELNTKPRTQLASNRYYPILDAAIQTEPIILF